jgi:hypothetical protein
VNQSIGKETKEGQEEEEEEEEEEERQHNCCWVCHMPVSNRTMNA